MFVCVILVWEIGLVECMERNDKQTKKCVTEQKSAERPTGQMHLTVGDMLFVCCIVLLITLILKLPYFIMQDFCNID